MAALDFPNSPAVGDDFVNWQWDGVKWNLNPNISGIPGPPGPTGPPGATGPAGPPGPNTMPPGITNGSQAAAGQVGEILVLTGTLSAAPDTGTLVTGTIPPGDWEISVLVVCNATLFPPP